MLGRVLLGLSGSERMRNLVERAPISRGIVARFIAGDETADAVRAAADLASAGLTATIDHLGEDTLDRAQAERVAEAYVELLAGLRDAGLTEVAEVSVKLSAVGQALPGDGEKIALDNAREICRAAADAGTTVTLDMEDHTTTDSTLAIATELRGISPPPESRCRHICTEPKTTAGGCPARVRECACARARTTNRSTSPTRTRPTSTAPTCDA